MNVAKIINGILDTEGEGTPPYLAKDDAGGRTSWGISERAHPGEWLNGPPTRDRAYVILLTEYLTPFIPLKFYVEENMIAALVDDAVMSGPKAAIMRLQYVVGTDMDGIIGHKTTEAILAYFRTRTRKKLQQDYVVERAFRITRLVQRRPTDITNLTGWISRILTFLPEV